MSTMHGSLGRLRGVDLDLLVCFDMIIRTGNVTRAAEAVGMSQSAMSHALRRLRTHFDDPLFVRAGSGVAPTPFAEALEEPLRHALLALQDALETPQGFDPHEASRTFRLCAPDLFDALVLPRLVQRVHATAPHVDLVALGGIDGNLEQALSLGELDLAVVAVPGGPAPSGPSALVRRTLFRDDWSCFLRRDHPSLQGGTVTLHDYLRLPHLLVSPDGRGPGVVDHILEAQGQQRRVAVRVPSFASALRVLGSTDLVLTGPSSLEHFLEDDTVARVSPPLPLPDHGVAMVWHRRFDREPGLSWLREQLSEVLQELGVG